MSISYQPQPGCPDAAVLARYHEQKLGGDQARTLAEHVKGCQYCQRRLARLDLLARASNESQDADDDEDTVAGNPSGSGAFTMVDDPRARPTDRNRQAVPTIPPGQAAMTDPLRS